MRHHRILLALAGAGLVSLPILSPQAGRDQQRPAFDALFTQPQLYVDPARTHPFQPGQQL
jgi:hypothetical protein